MRGIRFGSLVMVIALMTCGGMAIAGSHDDAPDGLGPFAFALIGDVPYGVAAGQDYPPFDAIIDEVNADRRLLWVLHAGDIKGGSSPCSDAMFVDRLQRYNRFDKPVILTPGDNEWTDCHRAAAGGYLPLERLAKLRDIFYAEPGRTIGGRTMQVDTQADVAGYEEFPENVMWTHQRIVFAAMHIVGSQNALADFAQRTQADDDEVERRIAAALAWLDKTFDKAEQRRSPGVFIMIHGNPGLERSSANRNGFVEFLTELEAHVQAYGKPVVLAHGDSHYFRVDKPALVNTNFLPNFTRVETFGSGNVHWLQVYVDPRSEQVFTFQQQIMK